jgi:hypothetical protein
MRPSATPAQPPEKQDANRDAGEKAGLKILPVLKPNTVPLKIQQLARRHFEYVPSEFYSASSDHVLRYPDGQSLGTVRSAVVRPCQSFRIRFLDSE